MNKYCSLNIKIYYQKLCYYRNLTLTWVHVAKYLIAVSCLQWQISVIYTPFRARVSYLWKRFFSVLIGEVLRWPVRQIDFMNLFYRRFVLGKYGFFFLIVFNNNKKRTRKRISTRNFLSTFSNVSLTCHLKSRDCYIYCRKTYVKKQYKLCCY